MRSIRLFEHAIHTFEEEKGMTLRVIGAGFGRTGTTSLKFALETLLGAPCYHMREALAYREHVPVWHHAALGKMPNWHAFLTDYAATVSFPAAAFWAELADAFPEALVLLSVRDPETWWNSASETIFKVDHSPVVSDAHKAMIKALYTLCGIPDRQDRDAAIGAFKAHNARVREVVPSDRLIIWQPGDGWEPICHALNLPIPEAPFPRTNTTAEWRTRVLQA